jgi:hypothetical protein
MLRAIQLTFFGKAGEGEVPGVPEAARLSHIAGQSIGDETLARSATIHTGETLGRSATLPPITWPERAGALLLIAATVVIGLKPDIFLNWIEPSLNSPVFQAVLKGGAP